MQMRMTKKLKYSSNVVFVFNTNISLKTKNEKHKVIRFSNSQITSFLQILWP